MEHTRFRITDFGTGWLTWQVTGPGIDQCIHSSWVGEFALSPMLRLAVSMVEFRREGYFWHMNTEEWSDFRVSFAGEPECYRATFREPKADEVAFLLERSDDDMGTPHAPYVKMASGAVSIDQFAADLLADSDDLLRRFGIVGFADNWQHEEFPLAAYIRLRQVCRGEEPYKLGLAQELATLAEILHAAPEASPRAEQ